MALSGQAMPDHATIAAFIRRSPEAIQAVFQGPDQLTCTCPAGKTLYRNGANVRINGRTGIKFTAPKSACEPCHLRARCLKDEHQRSPRQVVFFHSKEEATPQGLLAKMKEKIDSLRGRMTYSRRLGTVEPPFGNLRYHKRLDRFTLRGRKKVEGQWKLYALVRNIEKLAHAGVLG